MCFIKRHPSHALCFIHHSPSFLFPLLGVRARRSFLHRVLYLPTNSIPIYVMLCVLTFYEDARCLPDLSPDGGSGLPATARYRKKVVYLHLDAAPSWTVHTQVHQSKHISWPPPLAYILPDAANGCSMHTSGDYPFTRERIMSRFIIYLSLRSRIQGHFKFN